MSSRLSRPPLRVATSVLVLTAVLLSSCTKPPAVATSHESPPNILLIYVDDWGWQDAGFMGSRYYETPNIDDLANDSIRFTHAYSAAPNCAPSRAALLSGQYAPRTGVYTVNNPAQGADDKRRLIPAPNEKELAAQVVTLAESLKAAGYQTAHIGKWHLGEGELSGPRAQGFDVNIAGNRTGTQKGGYFPPYENPELADGPQGEYLTDRLTDEAIRYIEQQHGRPFFVYLAHYAVHTPIQAPEQTSARFATRPGVDGQENPVYAAMLEHVDTGVGRLLATLDRLGVADNTLVILTSDNGGHGAYTTMPDLRGEKGTIYEGGIRIPLLIRNTDRSGAGRTESTPTNAVDLYPTLMDAARIQVPEDQVLDGQSIWPLLRGETQSPREPLFWHFPAYLGGIRDGQDFRTTPVAAIREGDYKLIEFFEFGQVELFDVVNDPAESNNLALERPELTNRLYRKMQAWRSKTAAAVPSQPNPDYDEGNRPQGFATMDDVTRALDEREPHAN